MEKSIFIKKLTNIRKKNLVLLGHMGSGKTLLAKKIARELKIEHYDSDQKIVELEKKSISEIFESRGEKYFRKIEEKVVLNLIQKKNIVVSLGGGSIMNKNIRNMLKQSSFSIFLDVNLEKLESRLSKSKNRPLLKNTNILNKLKDLDTQRRKYYLDSDVKLQNTGSISNTYMNFIDILSKINVKNYKFKNKE
jgi:shikimate kinase